MDINGYLSEIRFWAQEKVLVAEVALDGTSYHLFE